MKNNMRPYWDKAAKRFLETEYQKLWRTYSDLLNFSLISRWLGKHHFEYVLKTDLFDEAVSEGVYPLIQSRFKHVVGIDISKFVLDNAQIRYPDLKCVIADIRSLPFKDETFDVIISNSTLDQFRSKDALFQSIRELIRVLKIEGKLLITLDNPANPIIALRRALPFRYLYRLGILQYYVGATLTPKSLYDFLEQVGLKVKEAINNGT